MISSTSQQDPGEEPLEALKSFLRFPSISTQPEHAPDLAACAEWLREKLSGIGLAATVHSTPGSPVVVAATPRDPAKRTVLIYGHYDVHRLSPGSMKAVSTPVVPPTTRGRSSPTSSVWRRPSARMAPCP